MLTSHNYPTSSNPVLTSRTQEFAASVIASIIGEFGESEANEIVMTIRNGIVENRNKKMEQLSIELQGLKEAAERLK